MSTQQDLVGKTCVPCRGGEPRLDRKEAKEYLGRVEGWSLNDDATRIERRFEFGTFPEAQAFAVKVGELSEEQFHHPEVTFGWGYCSVMFQTRKIRGLHENDFIMAAKVNELYERAAG